MREREESEESVIWLEVVTNQGADCTDGRDEIRVLNDNTLRRARGAGSIYDTSHIILRRDAAFGSFGRYLTAEFAQGVKGKYGHAAARVLDLGEDLL
jgi:hypothetical protein